MVQLLARIEFTTAILLSVPVFWLVKPCNRIIDFRRSFEKSGINNENKWPVFRATVQKTMIFDVTACYCKVIFT